MPGSLFTNCSLHSIVQDMELEGGWVSVVLIRWQRRRCWNRCSTSSSAKWPSIPAGNTAWRSLPTARFIHGAKAKTANSATATNCTFPFLPFDRII